MDFDYDYIKEEARVLKTPVKDLLALSPGNDPFYVGSPGQIEKARWFGKVYEMMGKPQQCHIRRVHYWLVSADVTKPDGKPYENTINDWGLVTMAAKYARYTGFVPIENIIDRRNPPPIVNVQPWDHDNPSDIKDETDAESVGEKIIQNFYCYNPHKTQKYMLEIWSEKSTMNDVLEPICKEYGCNLVTGLGELSITAVHNLMKRIYESEKPTRIFYISDFDPAGECMPVSVARKIEYFMRDKGSSTNVKLKQIMLTAGQCEAFKLPRTPIKQTERRKDDFEERHGTGATELDALEALHPGVMRSIIVKAVSRYLDEDSWNKAIQINDEVRAKVREHIQGKIQDVLADLDLSEYDDMEIENDSDIDDSDEHWLYDSDLDYYEQLDLYKDHKS